MGAAVQVSIQDHGIEPLLKRILENIREPRPVLNLIGETVRASVHKNFEKEGRPDPWPEHSALTQQRRGKNAAILRDSTRLSKSISWQAEKDRVVVGTNTLYAAVHQFGAKKGSFGVVETRVKEHWRVLRSGKKSKVKAHTRKQPMPWGDIPARPFMMVQEEDWDFIRAGITRLFFE